MKKLVLVDFDDTLVNSEMFKRDLLEILRKYKLNNKGIGKIFKQNENFFSLDKFIRESLELEINKQIIFSMQKKILELINNFKKYNFIDSKLFLDKLNKEKDIKTIIFSKGDREFQLLKIKNSKLLKNNQNIEIKITAGEKARELKNITLKYPNKLIFFINDKQNENNKIREYKKKFNYNIIIIEKVNKIKNKKEREDIKVFNNFSDIYSLILSKK